MAKNDDNCIFFGSREANGDTTCGPDIIEIDPNLTAPQTNIPNFPSMNGRWPSESSMSIPDRIRSGNAPSFGSDLLRCFEIQRTDGDIPPSPDAAQSSSNRPTPNSSTSSSERRHNSSSSNSGNLTAPGSGQNSFEASPASSTNANSSNSHSPPKPAAPSAAYRTMDALFQSLQSGADFPTGLTPDQQFTLPETPGKAGGDDAAGEGAGDFNWEQFTTGTTGMTPVSEGVLRTMLQMGAMETMDMGWDNPT